MQGVSDVTCVCKNSWVEWMIQLGKLQSGLPRLWYRDKITSDKGCFSSLSGPWKRRLCSLEKKIISFLCLCLFLKKTRTTKEEWILTLSKCHMHKMMMRCGFLKIRRQIGHYSQFAITPFKPMLFDLYFHTSFSCTVILGIKIRFDWGFFQRTLQ